MIHEYDVIVIGAGFGGLYALHKIRDELGLRVKGFDAGGGPGGTWWWNRYPGARCDIDSVHYCYSFSDEIQREWEWSEQFASQPELQAYFEFVADKIDVRKEITFNARVTATDWDDQAKRWIVTTDTGETCRARFVIAATGNMSAPKAVEYSGADDFEGELYVTGTWPDKYIDFSGKRVGVIGTGASGVQVIQTIASQVDHLTVFQRTANFCTPLSNRPIDPAERRWFAQNHETVRAGSREHPFGTPYEMPRMSSHMDSAEERRARYKQMLYGGGLRLIGSAYADVLTDEKSNTLISDFVREHIAERVKDPAKLRKLIPSDHPYGTKRPPLEINYFEAYNRDNVDLVDIKVEPILQITKAGIKTAEHEYPLDMIIFATGFDAVTGSLLRLNITGVEGRSLAAEWSHGPRNFLGLAIHGFPNLFTITGPTAAVALYNNPLAIEDHVNLSAAAIKYCIDNNVDAIEATQEAQDRWAKLADDLLGLTLFPKAKSWYMGANVPGKPIATAIFVAPAPLYRAYTGAVEAEGFSGFALDGHAKPYPALLKLDASLSLVLAGAILEGVKPFELCTVEEMRATVDDMAMLQGPERDVLVTQTRYPGGGGQEQAARIYQPNVQALAPVMLFFHGGGFVAGSLDAFDRRCRALAEDLGVVVIAPSYRLAPEHPFPAAVHDSFAALGWAARIASEYGGDPSRLIVAGESAGGNLAAVTALRARDERWPDVAAQILITPAIDAEADTQSRVEFAHAPFMSTAAVERCWSLYLGDRSNAQSILASPNRANSLKGLPPTLILTAEIDPIRDEGEEFARKLQQAGVNVTIQRIEGMVHASFCMEAKVPKASDYTKAMASFLSLLLTEHRFQVTA